MEPGKLSIKCSHECTSDCRRIGCPCTDDHLECTACRVMLEDVDDYQIIGNEPFCTACVERNYDIID